MTQGTVKFLGILFPYSLLTLVKNPLLIFRISPLLIFIPVGGIIIGG